MASLDLQNCPDHLKVVAGADAASLAATLAEQVARWLEEALEAGREASLALSGGSTPVLFLRALSRQAVDWERVWITLVDERWVPPDHEDSNAALVQRELLQGRAAVARFVPLKTDHADPWEGQPFCEERLADLPWPLDVAVLGMGSDGHTASLFPGAPELARALAEEGTDRCAAITAPGAGHPRVTLTRSTLMQARHRILHITGEGKRQVLARALEDLSDELSMPVRAFLKAPLHLFWSP